MIRLKLLNIRYDPYGGGAPQTDAWRTDFNDYLEHGWLRGAACTALLDTLEHLHWSNTECYTVLDAAENPRPVHSLPENTLLALTLAENSRRKKYTWLPADATQAQCEDMAARVWPALQALAQPILVKGLYALHNDRGLLAAMDRTAAVFEIRRRGNTFRDTLQEMAPKLEPNAYNSMRLLMAVNKGLADRPIPFPDEPLPFTPDASDADVLQQYSDVLAELGFTLEPFGRSDYILRGVPAQLDAADALPALEEICAQLRHGAQMDAQSVRDEVLKTVACKAAIKAGWQTEPEELLRLADAVCAGEVKYCPHGRPVAVTLTRRELDKLFKRIV